jgi:RecG-like helicase
MRLLIAVLLLAAFSPAKCIPFTEARKNIGETRCVTGKVVKVYQSRRSGTHFLNFCADHRNCPFAVVVFARDLPHVGDVRWFEGRTLEIYGKIKDYKGQAEIILSDVRQLRGEAARLPVLPKHYDVQTRGSYSAGRIHPDADPPKPKRPDRRGGSDAAGEADPPQ